MSCPDCFRGAAHDGKPSGVEETIGGIVTYVANPTSGATACLSTIIFITDAFGFNLANSKLLADEYASRTGCRVLVPDIIPGGGVSVDSLELMERAAAPVGILDIAGQVTRVYNVVRMMSRFVPFAMRTRNVFPSVLAYARTVKAEMPAGGKLGAAGFCWGGLQTTKLSAEAAIEGGDEPLLDAHFTAHPAGLKTPDDFVHSAKKFHVPVSVAVGDNDMILSIEAVQDLDKSLKAEFDGDPSHFQVTLYPECGHGFAVRADPKKTVENMAAEQAATQAVDWFKRFLF
ncbi:dienelactone hydrolase [Dactylonectria macrodidyma]|uniref:Dienelactone hydrolase n=1 Tax=Dactylonectria macrodidyma TaxID=307937 RepID=A0A9P9E3G1_9HYPO|nr:dienelactone hydrolase [Dactylonectria macrodidyma]